MEAVELGLGDGDDRPPGRWKGRHSGRRGPRADRWRRDRVRDFQIAIDVLAVEMRPVVVTLLQFAAFPEIAETGVVDDRDKGRLPIGERLLVAEAELVQSSFQLAHHLVDTGVDALPTLLQEEIRIAAKELQVILKNAVAVHELVRPLRHGLIGFDAGGIGHLDQ